MKVELKALIPHVVAIAVFYGITLFYFSPFIKGYQLKQGDIVSFKGMSKEIQDHRHTYEEEPLWTNAMFGGMPAYQVTVRYTSNLLGYLDTAFRGFIPGPISNLFLCLLAFYILLCTLKIDPWLSMAGAIAFGLSSYFPILIEAGHNAKLHAIGYLPLVLAGMLMVYRGQLLRGGLLFGVSLSLEVFSNHVQVTYYFAGACLIILIGYLYAAIKRGDLKDFVRQNAVLGIAAVFAILSNAALLWNTYQYTQETMRGGSELTIVPGGAKNENKTSGLDLDYLTQWSYGIDESWSLLVPEIKGGASGAAEMKRGQQINAYWGDQPFTSGPVYIGAFVFLLFVLGFVLLDGYLKWSFLAVSIFFFMVAWGRNMMWFTELMANYMPMYNKFRTPSMALLVVELVAPLLAILTVKRFVDEPELLSNKEVRKKAGVTVGVVVFTLLLFAATPDSFFGFFSPQEEAQFAQMGKGANVLQVERYQEEVQDFRMGVLRGDALRSLLFIALGLAASIFFIRKRNPMALGLSLSALFLLDLWTVDKRYVNNEKVRGKYVRWEKKRGNYFIEHLPSKADESILNEEIRLNPELGSLVSQAIIEGKEKAKTEDRASEAKYVGNERFKVYNQNTNFRVYQLNNPFNESRTSFYHKSVGGYSAVKLGRYQDLIDFYLHRQKQAIISELENGGVNINNVLREQHILNMLNTKYIIYNQNADAIRNPFALGNAWFVGKVELAENADDEIQKLGAIDPRTTVVIDKRYQDQLSSVNFVNGMVGSVEMTNYKANELSYKTKNESKGFVVFSEIYYKRGWNAYVDGAEVPIIRVNYLMRGVEVPGGDHEVVLKFEPKDYSVSMGVGYASSGIMLFLVLLLFFNEFKARNAVKA